MSAMGKTVYLTPHSAAKEIGCRPQTITAGCNAGTIDHVRVETPRGLQPRLTRETIDELKRRGCSSPGCAEPAPGPSGRCGKHSAKVKVPAEHRQCEYCGADMGVIPGSRLKLGRGIYCSNRCKGLAAHEREPDRLPTLNPAGAREHHRLVELEVDRLEQDEGLVRPAKAAERMGLREISFLLVHHYGGNLAGEVRSIRGSDRLMFRESDLVPYIRGWVTGGDGRRRSWFDPSHALARLEAKGIVADFAARHGLDVQGARAVLRQRVEDRRADLRRQSPGAPRKDALRRRLAETARRVFEEELEATEVRLSAADTLRAAVILDWEEHPESWPRDRYPAAADTALGMDRGTLRSATDKARKLIGDDVKALQTAQIKTRAA
jgi:hypothetical protein